MATTALTLLGFNAFAASSVNHNSSSGSTDVQSIETVKYVGRTNYDVGFFGKSANSFILRRYQTVTNFTVPLYKSNSFWRFPQENATAGIKEVDRSGRAVDLK